jgi:hypothetical protein
MASRSRKAPKRKSHATNRKAPQPHPLDVLESSALPKNQLISDAEKHELIRAHADSRAMKSLSPGLGYYVAVGISCVMVGAGWLMTLDANYGLHEETEPDSAVQAVKEGVTKFRQETEVVIPAMKENVERLTDEIQKAADAEKDKAEEESVSSTEESAVELNEE